MTDKGKLTDLLIHENDTAKLSGFAYLHDGEAIIRQIVAEISDETAAYMVDVLTTDKLAKKRKSDDGARDEHEWLQTILWEIYFRGVSSAKEAVKWQTMQKALADLYDQRTRFYSVSQSRITNAMATLFTNGLQMDIEGNATATVGTRPKSRVEFKLVRAHKHTVRPSAKKLKDYLLKDFQETHSACTSVPLKKYAMDTGKDPENRNSMIAFRKQVVEDLETLRDISGQYYEKINGRFVKSGYIGLNGGTAAIINGVICWDWSPRLIPELEQMAPIDYSSETFLADTRTAAYDFSSYIDLNYRRNEGKDTVNKIKIATLLSCTDKIPDIDELKHQRASTKTRVIRPFLEALDSLNRILYDVYTKDGELVADPLEMNIDDFRKGYIVVDYSSYPQHPDRIKKRDKKHK